jgi:hypothetical protein
MTPCILEANKSDGDKGLEKKFGKWVHKVDQYVFFNEMDDEGVLHITNQDGS